MKTFWIIPDGRFHEYTETLPVHKIKVNGRRLVKVMRKIKHSVLGLEIGQMDLYELIYCSAGTITHA